ncbi:MAG TPA: NADH-quinone oxidoreductase subunit M [Candidatus Baltobacteraceae bacterium]|jgi:NADH-quinone oxidoreductase subunit M|nr:NADH-quinone oxidoreductase subunit M [Candidatus Baltobacteraceae bacterium]
MIWPLVLVPFLVGLSIFAFPRRADALATGVGIFVALGTLVATVLLSSAPDETLPWITRPSFPFASSFHVGLGSGLSFWLVLLTALTSACALLTTTTQVPRRRDFVAWMVLLQGAMTGVFVARDLLMFALFWDLMLIPVFVILIGWSAGHRASAWRYLLYNGSAGLLLLIAVAAYGITTGSTDVLSVSVTYLKGNPLGPMEAWLFIGFALAFLVKTPVWPFHTWMPTTYADLPAPAVAVVSAVQSKAGLYGFLAVTTMVFPAATHVVAPVMIVLGTVGVVAGAFAALVQTDVKRIVAYSSLSHLGLILAAIFTFDPIALSGAVVYMIAHGLFSAALFLTLGSVEQRTETRLLRRMGGLGIRNPRLAGALVISALAALGLPGLCGFAGEILILTGLFRSGAVWPTMLALVATVAAAAYMLRLFQGIMHGPEAADLPQRSDLQWAEGLALVPLVLGMVWLGINPSVIARAVPASASLSMDAHTPAPYDTAAFPSVVPPATEALR